MNNWLNISGTARQMCLRIDRNWIPNQLIFRPTWIKIKTFSNTDPVETLFFLLSVPWNKWPLSSSGHKRPSWGERFIGRPSFFSQVNFRNTHIIPACFNCRGIFRHVNAYLPFKKAITLVQLNRSLLSIIVCWLVWTFAVVISFWLFHHYLFLLMVGTRWYALWCANSLGKMIQAKTDTILFEAVGYLRCDNEDKIQPNTTEGISNPWEIIVINVWKDWYCLWSI